jgi:hypothetical protein
MAITNSALAQQISDMVAYWRTRDIEYAEWVAGTETGGPFSDGTYPLSDYNLNVFYVKSPAALQASVDGIVDSAEVFADAADASAIAAAASAAAAAASAGLALGYRDDALASSDLADAHRISAANAEANAAAYAAAAEASASQTSAPFWDLGLITESPTFTFDGGAL